MVEGRDKGIIQRVLDQIYEKFALRTDLKGNCEIKISFLEIYKENVTDLLEGYVSASGTNKHNNSKLSSPAGARRDGHNRDRSSSFIIHPNLASQDGSSVAAS